MSLNCILLTIYFLRLQSGIPFIDRVLEKISVLSGGREKIVLLVAAFLFLLLLILVRGKIKKAKRKKALQYHIEEKDKYHISMEKKDLSKLVSLLIEGLGGKDNIKSVRFDARKLKIKIGEYALVQEDVLRMAGFPGLVRPSKDEVHIFIGDEAGELCEALQNLNI